MGKHVETELTPRGGPHGIPIGKKVNQKEVEQKKNKKPQDVIVVDLPVFTPSGEPPSPTQQDYAVCGKIEHSEYNTEDGEPQGGGTGTYVPVKTTSIDKVTKKIKGNRIEGVIKGKNKGQFLNKRILGEEKIGSPTTTVFAGDVARQLVQAYVPELDVSNVETGTFNVEVYEGEYIPVSEALNQLAFVSDSMWYVNGDNDLYFHKKGTRLNPYRVSVDKNMPSNSPGSRLAGGVAVPNVVRNTFEWTTDKDAVINKVHGACNVDEEGNRVSFTVEDAPSIAEWGKREVAIVGFNNHLDPELRKIGDAIIRDYAQPIEYGKCEVSNVFDYKVGDTVLLYVSDIGLEGKEALITAINRDQRNEEMELGGKVHHGQLFFNEQPKKIDEVISQIQKRLMKQQASCLAPKRNVTTPEVPPNPNEKPIETLKPADFEGKTPDEVFTFLGDKENEHIVVTNQALKRKEWSKFSATIGFDNPSSSLKFTNTPAANTYSISSSDLVDQIPSVNGMDIVIEGRCKVSDFVERLNLGFADSLVSPMYGILLDIFQVGNLIKFRGSHSDDVGNVTTSYIDVNKTVISDVYYRLTHHWFWSPPKLVLEIWTSGERDVGTKLIESVTTSGGSNDDLSTFGAVVPLGASNTTATLNGQMCDVPGCRYDSNWLRPIGRRWVRFGGDENIDIADHSGRHTDGSDDIQDATAAQKGLATAAQITKLDGVEDGADVTGSHEADISLANLGEKNHASLTNVSADQHHNQSHTAASHSDQTATGAEVDDAVVKKHTQGTDTALGTQAEDLDMGDHDINNVRFIDAVQTVDQETTPSIYASQTASTLQDGSAGNTGSDEVFDNTWEAIKFTADGNHHIRSFGVRLKVSVLLTNPASIIYGYLYTDNAGVPGIKISGSAYTRFGSITTSYAEYQFAVSSLLSSGTSYWLVLKRNAVPTGGTINIDRGTTGTALHSFSANGLAWTTENNKQAWHRIYSRTSYAVYATSTNSYAVRATSTNSIGVYATSTNSIAGYFYINPSSTNTIVEVIRAIRGTSGVAANGIGGSLNFYVEDTARTHELISKICGVLINATSGSETSAFTIWTRTGGAAITERFRITGAGKVGVLTTTPSVNADMTLGGDGCLCLKETTTPTADVGFGKTYTKANNKLYFQDGAGVEHEIQFV